MLGAYDYVVVGGGTAGCVLAARLTEDPAARVLLVEAGSAAPSRALTVPNAWPENLGSAAEWGDRTVPQGGAGPVVYPRGRVLGGSGAVNALAHVRGHRLVYDGWAMGGAPRWGFGDLLPFFRRSEWAVGRDPVLRGTAGPVRVAPVPLAERHPVAAAFAAALAAAGCPVSGDLSGRVQEGVAWVDLAVAGGERCGPVQAYLRPALGRANLTVRTGCLVTGLVIERGRCTGVRLVQGGGIEQAHTSGEVLVCAGAIGSPQLLMLSGVGPAAQLRKAGIEPVADLPAGENLQDHPLALACYSVPAALPVSGFNHGEVCAAVRSRLAGAWPDVHVFPILLPLAPAGLEPPPAGFALAAAVVAAEGRGTVRLASADPGQRPLIDPGFLREPGDLDRLAEGFGLVRDTAAAGLARAGLAAGEVWPGPDVRSRAGVRDYLRHTAGSYYHPAGTCAIGTGAGTVVDPQLRVHGVEGLRVADASVMPVLPNAHPNATVLAIAERAATLITGR